MGLSPGLVKQARDPPKPSKLTVERAKRQVLSARGLTESRGPGFDCCMSFIESAPAGGSQAPAYNKHQRNLNQCNQPNSVNPTSFFSSNKHLIDSPSQLSPTFASPNSDSPAPATDGHSTGHSPRKKQRTTSSGTTVGLMMNLYQTNVATTAPTGAISPGDDSYGEDSGAEDHAGSFFGSQLPPVPTIDANGKPFKKPTLRIAKPTQSVRSNQSERAQSVDSDAPSKSGGTTKSKLKRSQSADKKKKAGRACASCQKAHLTCDDGN